MNILPHPTLLQSPDTVRAFERETGLRIIIIDGKPVIVGDAK